MERTKRRLLILLVPVCCLFYLSQHHRVFFAQGTFNFGSKLLDTDTLEDPVHGGVNATLGFGAVVAVSHASSPRREGLLWAAKLTGVEITIPPQPQWTEDDLQAFKSKKSSKIDRGSALAWMGHLNALRWFLSTPFETALIIEDDVDLSLHLPSQITLASHALRTLLTPTATLSIPNTTINTDPHFWAAPSTWEILWLGHCNDAASPHHILTHPSLAYPDPHMPPLSSIAAPASDLLRSFNLSDTRLVYKSYWPLCTFAYAVTRASAARILSAYATEGPDGCVAYDVRMLEACRDHGWKCWTVAPELFHHMAGKSEIAALNDVQAKNGSDNKGAQRQEETERRGPSVNIECAARNEGLWVDKEDTEGRRVMLEKVREAGRKGECFVGERGQRTLAGMH
ncbi:hypothetical protein BU23DRAFT_540726 [Bimuria novae-zelandiae CBS 107.79]|uniref:Glycosyltransferase family 25 protein n=1 Tax=Bimuria novae-zelandiae CBS 107.79 TaxID=1447943 RepID=A0A6A5UVB1_9PLEO|nr:hypothetical protein BU23DRAFT_540726 [Bimuria novae-zelandiae CBS 107.79]